MLNNGIFLRETNTICSTITAHRPNIKRHVKYGCIREKTSFHAQSFSTFYHIISHTLACCWVGGIEVSAVRMISTYFVTGDCGLYRFSAAKLACWINSVCVFFWCAKHSLRNIQLQSLEFLELWIALWEKVKVVFVLSILKNCIFIAINSDFA